MMRRRIIPEGNAPATLVSRSVLAGFVPVAISGICVVSLALLLMHSQHVDAENEARLRANSVAGLVAQQAELAIVIRDANELKRIAARTLSAPDVLRVEIKSADGNIGADSKHPEYRKSPADRVIHGAADVRASQPVSVFDSDPSAQEKLGSVRITLSTDRQEAAFEQNIRVALTLSASVLGIIYIVQKRRTRKILAPLRSVIEFTRCVAAGDLTRRAEVGDDGEIGELAISCNFMVAELEKSHRDLTHALEKAQESSRLKSEFLANMSHEIRTPLNGVLGMIDAALDGELNPRQREALTTAVSSAHSLLTTINDLLDFSRIEAGQVTLDSVQFDLPELVQEIGSTYRVPAQQNGVHMEWHLGADVPHSVLGDACRLRQVLHNLLSNAVKFTHQGTVSLRVGVRSQTKEHVWLEFRVRDTGVGIPKDKQKSVFQAFRQADGSYTRRYGGTGLGLTISRRLVEMMGGVITLMSEPGRGTEFVFTVKLSVPMADAGPERSGSVIARPLSVLLVEDNAVNQKVAKRLIEDVGHKVQLAADGVEALELLGHERFDLIFMDIQMPRMDGLTATRAIRAREAEVGGHTPVVAMTAHALSGDRERCLESGMDGYLAKPISRRDLLALLKAIDQTLTGPAAGA